MWKRLFLTFAELAIWVVVVAGVATAYGQSATRPAASKLPKDSQMPKSFVETTLIPRHVLFGNPERAMARMSPDGKWLSFLAPVKQSEDDQSQGVLNVWVSPADDLAAAKPVTNDKIRGIHGYSWAYNSQQIIYSQDVGGDENWHVYATNVETRETIDLTPVDGVNGQLMGTSEKVPRRGAGGTQRSQSAASRSLSRRSQVR
jgi:hypothetical protein